MTRVTVFNRQRDLPYRSKTARDLVSFLFEYLKIESDEVIIHLVTRGAIGRLHADYFNDPTPTDCISFSIDPRTILGEIFVCPSVAMEYAKKRKLDPTEELERYIIHGLLHLIGMDDLSPAGKKQMRLWENRCLKARKNRAARSI